MVAPPAGAHAVSGASASNYRTTLAGLEPATPGVSLVVIEAGARLQLTNDTATEIVVPGYTDEPYLRVGPAGVFANKRSPAYYLNLSRNGRRAIPAEADPTAEPRWERLSSGHVARWHDHRTHWMGSGPPDAVVASPDARQVIGDPWTISLAYGDATLVARGTLEWVPGPSPWPWLAVGGLVTIVVGLVAWRSRGRWPVAGLALALVAVDVVHVAGVAAAMVGPWSGRLATVFHASLLSLAAWVMAAGGAALLLRGNASGRVPIALGAVALAGAGGLADVAYLSHSTLPFGFAAVAGRLLVTSTLAVGVGLTLGLLAALAGPGLTLRPLGLDAARPPARPATPGD